MQVLGAEWGGGERGVFASLICQWGVAVLGLLLYVRQASYLYWRGQIERAGKAGVIIVGGCLESVGDGGKIT